VKPSVSARFSDAIGRVKGFAPASGLELVASRAMEAAWCMRRIEFWARFREASRLRLHHFACGVGGKGV